MQHSTSRIARAVIAALILTVLQPVLAQGSTAAQLQTARSSAVFAVARAKPAVKVQARASKGSVLVGQDVRVTGSAKPGRARDVVKVQRYDRGVWRTVKFSKLTGKRSFSFTVRPKAGKNRYRVVRPETSTGRRGTSKTVTVKAESCGAMPKPKRTMWALANNPTIDRTASMTYHLSRLFCAVAPKATVRIAMLFVAGDSEAKVILRSLEKMHRYRGVHIEVLAEAMPYKVNDTAKLRRTVGKFATVHTCSKGCRSDVRAEGNMHQKFVTVTDMTWSKGKDPVVWTSSANWDKKQLRRYWQTGVLVYNDRTLAREFDARFESMRTCSRAGGCGRWKPSVFGARLSDAYKVVSRNGVWQDAGFDWRAGQAGSGTKIAFSPTRQGFDPVTTELTRYTCTPKHRTIRIGVFRMSVYRGLKIAKAFGDLRRRGCDVKAVLSTSGRSSAAKHGVKDMRSQGIATTCVDLMHDKFAYLDVVDRTTKVPRKVLWTGSQNFTGAGVNFNDDLMMVMDATDARGQRASDIRALAGAYLGRWAALTRHRTGCPS
ncbi:MAG TPA: phospholipase D-like domain-containing protein [Actinomycetales bacterium]|nr:phospholipase D-like domain-containing protein [Actinomycetales bacterium]